MFPSLDTNGYELFDCFNPHQTTMLPTFTTHIQCPSFLPFSPDESFLFQQQDAEVGVVESSKNVLVQKKKDKCVDGTPRIRMGKKRDRHSKICTAQGPRDRRMRLSLQIARKFFDLQDMLGFDKASKTIEWLISKSKTSIKQVKENAAASGSGGEEHLQVDGKPKNEPLKVSKRRTNTMESSCTKKESREKARERARERTATKMKMRLSSGLIETSSDPNQETRKTSGAQVEQQWTTTTNVNIIEKFLGLTSDSTIFKDSDTSLATRAVSGMVTPREHNTTSVDEERSPSYFSIYDYLCY